MKSDFKKLKIETLLWILSGVFIFIAIAGFFIIKSTVKNVDTAEAKVETAQALNFEEVNLAAVSSNPEREEVKASLQKHSTKNENIINTLSKGGFLIDSISYTDGLSGTASKRLKHLKILWDSVHNAVNTWRFEPSKLDSTVQETVQIPNNDSLNTFRTEIQNKVISVDNPKVVMARSFIVDNSDELSGRKSALINALQDQLQDAKNTISYVIFFVILINVVVLILIILSVRKIVLNQLQTLDNTLVEINDGNFDVSIDLDWKNEIQAVAEKVIKLSTKLKLATNFVKEVEKGQLNARFEGIDEKSLNKSSLEGALVDMRDQMKKVEKEEEIRKWSTGGLAKFVDILRSSNDDVNELSDEIISNLVEYTHSNQGGLYLLNDEDEDDKYLELISLYAFNQKKFEEQRYKLGEGLVGQTFLEKKTTYLLEVPNEYIKITSGLGGANPKAILVVPLQVNKQIFGIIELASFEEYADYEIEFVEKLGESIASTIASVKNNQRTKKLLEDSQALTEQMQAQEEEMRQNMEELSATQEEMARKEIEISAKITAINNTIGTVEYDAVGIITNSNAIFLKKMNYSADQLHDLSFDTLYGDEDDLWRKVTAGQSVEGVYSFNKSDGSTILLETSFTPVYNDENKVSKIIQLVTNFGNKENIGGSDIGEVEFSLRQNLEELEITQEQLDNKLKFTEEKLSLFNQKLPYVLLDEKLIIKEANKALADLYSISRPDILGSPIENILGKEIKDSINNKDSKSAVNMLIAGGESQLVDIKIIYTDDENSNVTKAMLIWL